MLFANKSQPSTTSKTPPRLRRADPPPQPARLQPAWQL